MEFPVARELELVVVDIADGRPVENTGAVAVHCRDCAAVAPHERFETDDPTASIRERGKCRDSPPSRDGPGDR